MIYFSYLVPIIHSKKKCLRTSEETTHEHSQLNQWTQFAWSPCQVDTGYNLCGPFHSDSNPADMGYTLLSEKDLCNDPPHKPLQHKQ